MPWQKLQKDDFISCMVGRVLGDPDYHNDEIAVAKSPIPTQNRTKLVDGKIIADAGDMILVQRQTQKEFKATYEEFVSLEYENQHKISEIALKIK